LTIRLANEDETRITRVILIANTGKFYLEYGDP
jgi:hypothetical protein